MVGESAVTTKITGLDETLRRIDALQRIIQEPDIDEAVRAMATIWEANFAAEGSMVGGWRDLAMATNRLREQRGYPPAHPILVQSGTLKNVAIDALRDGPHGASGEGVSLSYSRAPRNARLTLSGPKVSNQFRMRDASSDQPARPFWIVNDEVESTVARTIWEKMAERISSI